MTTTHDRQQPMPLAMAIGNWQLAIGNGQWAMGNGNWQLAMGQFSENLRNPQCAHMTR